MFRFGSITALVLTVVLATPALAEQRQQSPGAGGSGQEDIAPPDMEVKKERKLFEALDAGLRAYERQDYTNAIRLLTSVAKAGEDEAQFILGRLHDEGLGTKEDKEAAARWYRLAAGRGHAKAQYRLAQILRSQKPVDEGQVFNLLIGAARKGHSSAQIAVAHAYDLGLGVDQDYRRALYWLRKAAYGGDKNAQRTLGAHYFASLHSRPDNVLALKWLTLASRNGDKPASAWMKPVREVMTRSEIREAERIAKFE